MLTSLALIFLAGLAMAALCSLLRLPRIIGMLFTGILIGPYVLGLLDPSILAISADLRQMALIIILIKAGLSLDLGDLRRVGRPAVLMSFLPASFEILAYILFAPMLLGITRLEAAVMGAVLGAVSPAVVVPRMVRLMEEGRGTREGVPQLILAGASCDDVFVIVLFSAFTGMAQGGSVNLAEFVGIPVSICTGILLGLAVGWLLCRFFDLAWNRGLPVRGSMKVLIVLGISFLYAFNNKPLLLSGTAVIIIISLSIRRMPYTIRPALGEIRQAVDRCRSAALRAGGRGSGYPLHPPGRSRRRGDDPAGPLCPGGGRSAGSGRHPSGLEGAALLRHCLSAQGHGTGCYRFGAAGNGAALRSPGALGGSAGDPHHCAAGSHRHRQYLPPSAASRRLIFPFSPNKKPELSAQESSGFCFISQCYRISTCSAFMALRAFSWASGVTPAQQLARTVMGTSGQ